MKSIFTLLLLGLQFHLLAQADSRTISGVVITDEGSQPIEGATITVKGSNRVSGTQADGVYYITVNNDDSVLIFTSSEFQSKEVHLSSSKNNYDVRLARASFTAQYAAANPGDDEQGLIKPVIVEGTVFFENSRDPARHVYLYIVEGEEEALTDENGYFKITTWQPLPLKLTVKYKEQPKFQLPIGDASKKQTVWVRR